MNFDGSASSDYIDAGNDVSLQFSGSSFTISAWVKIDLNAHRQSNKQHWNN